jgi:hypothetical protein
MNLIEVLQELNIPFNQAGESPHVTTGWVGVECPYCGKGTGKTGLGFCLDGRRVCVCWKCGVKSVTAALIELSGQPYRTIKTLLNDLETDPTLVKPKVRGKLQLPECLGPLLKPHREYLKSRGFNPKELVKLWQLQGIGLAPKLQWRVFIPFLYEGETVSWTTRSIVPNANLRYVSAKPEEESIAMNEALWGEDYVRHSIVVTEGAFDAMKIGPGAVAIMGLNVSPTQIMRISKYPTRAVCFDSEAEAQQRARSLCNTLSALPGKTIRIELDSKDAASSSDREVKKIREEFL